MTSSSLFASREFTRYYGDVQSSAIREAARLTAQTEHPDVPPLCIGSWRSTVAELLVRRAFYVRDMALSDEVGASVSRGGLRATERAADSLAAHLEASRQALEVFTGYGWSLERAREIVAGLVSEHEDRARKYVRSLAA